MEVNHVNVVQLDGTQLAYVDRGEGDPVVFVHGTLLDFRSWGLQIDAFAREYRTVTYSRRYHYPNPWSGDGTDYTNQVHADDLAGLIDALGLEPANVVGQSGGAEVAFLLALRHPGLVRTLVLEEPGLTSLVAHDPEARQLVDDFMANVVPAGEALGRGETENAVAMFVDSVAGEGAFHQYDDEVRTVFMDNVPALQLEMSSPDLAVTCEEAREVMMPTLLLKGETSPRMFHLIADELDRCLPNSECATIPSASHPMPLDNPEAHNDTVLDFLRRHSA